MSGIFASLAVAAIGAGTSAYANNQAMRSQDKAAAAGIIRQGQLKQQANADVQTNIKQATANQGNVDKNQSALQDQYTAALQRAAPVQGTNGALPGASKKYAADTAAAVAANKQFGSQYASTAAAADAPALTNLQTQEGLGNTATQLGSLTDQSNQQGQLTNLQVQSIAANPWLVAAGNALQGAGTSAAGKYAYGYMNAPAQTGGNAGGSGSLVPTVSKMY